ncbi:ABC transporter permease [Phyllobacterium sophorae]|uniref:Peptide ABC transporter permease n=1 Tax=Phyllobacterium sophorae TaxID=1520277 RepID=A0A2P7AQI3_9HYPH|nr:ABC transporter permease [Phyllobacterium sophorae]PSH56484.1 peptide ABC transporter permease [Phyllobacterium sophorae]
MSPSGNFPLLIVASFLIVAVFVLLAIFAAPLSPHNVADINLLARFRPPVFLGGTWDYPLGTDRLGRDMLSLILRGIQISLTIAAVGTICGAIFGTTLGLLSGWVGGLLDNLVGILVDFQATIPNLILILALVTIMPEANFVAFVIIMAMYGWDRYARLARAIALNAKNQPYVQAQQVIGASAFRIVTRSVLPNFMAVLLVTMSLSFPQTILLETTLSFLGIGIQPPDTSLGVLIGEGRGQLYNAPWVVLLPASVILLATISISMLGDWARDRVGVD